MSLVIRNVSKNFGKQKALDSISFSVDKGEIVGFLGPNGAGKSTTMKITTGYIPPDEGSVELNGIDVSLNSLKVKQLIGYLPEHNPLYLDMYVKEYLRFVGKLHRINRSRLNERIEEMIQLCGLEAEQHKKMESLSKGYRQRVGLAQALLHDPAVLILDEPTSGLDPNQIQEIRNLIKAISHNKTVLFSSHIMQEVEALCNRVVIINKGKIVADDLLSNLMQKKENITIIVEFKGQVPIDMLGSLAGVHEIVSISKNKYKIVAKAGVDLRSSLFQFTAEHRIELVELKVEEHSFEEIFKTLTSSPQ